MSTRLIIEYKLSQKHRKQKFVETGLSIGESPGGATIIARKQT
jgi:hypothetical protein